jgi:DNA transformation protein
MITDTRDPLARRNSNSRRHFNFDNWTTGVKREIKDLPNLGQFMSKRLAEIGITNEDELRKIGAGQAYVRLKFLFGREITLNALWAMDATLSGIDWRLLSEERKQELLAQLPKLGQVISRTAPDFSPVVRYISSDECRRLVNRCPADLRQSYRLPSSPGKCRPTRNSFACSEGSPCSDPR